MNRTLLKNNLRLFAAASALAVFFPLLATSESTASVRIGSPCAKERQSAKIGSVKLLCIKVDKSLQWWQASAPLTYAFGPAGRLQYRYVDGKQERLNSNKQFVGTDKRGAANFHPIRVAAYKSLRSLESDKSLKNIRFDYVIQPNFPSEIAEVIKAQSMSAASYLSPILEKPLEVKLVLVTEKDKQFIDNKLDSIIPSQFWLGALQVMDFYGSLETFYSRSGTGGGTASYLPEKGYAYYIGHTSSFATMKTYWPEVAPHEMGHVFQGVLSNGVDNIGQEYGEGHPKGKLTGHLIEGSANTLGMAFGFENLGWYNDEMDLLLQRDIAYFTGDVRMKTNGDAIKLIKLIESRNSELSSQLSYSAGQFLWEYFVGKYGAEKLMELYRNVGTSENFSTNIKETIGISKEKFYKDAAPYLLANWQRLS